MTSLTSMCAMVCQIIQKKQEEKQIEEDQAANAQYWKIPACRNDDDDYNFAITPNEPVDSLSMGDENLYTIPAMESDEFIKSCVENLIPNPSESEGENGCDVPACFTTFSNILFDAEYEFDSVDDPSLSDEDVPEKIFLNPLFEEEIISMKIDPHHFNVESDLIESLLNHDSFIIPSSSKIDSFLDEFAEEIDLTFNPDYPMSPSIKDADYDSERNILIREELLDNYSLSLPVNESFHFDIPSFFRPLAKPPDGNTGILNIKTMGDISKQKLSSEFPMMIHGKNIPILDVSLFHLYPLDQFKVTHKAYQCQTMNEDYYHEQNSCYDYNSIGFDQSQPQQYTVNHPIFNAHNDFLDSQNKFTIAQTKIMEQMTSLTSMCAMILACRDDDDDYNFVITTNEPVDSLSMGDENLYTILAMESDEFIKSCVENLIPNPSESEGENGCDVPACFTTFSNILFDVEYEFDSVDDQSLSDEDVPKKIFLNPLFEEEIISMKIDPHHFNDESDLIESLLNHDSFIISSSLKIDSFLDEFAGELTLLKSILSRIDKTECHPENQIQEIDLTFNPDYPMSPSIKDADYDSERNILIREELLDNYSLSLPVNESFHFDIPSFFRPLAKPPDGNTGILNIKTMGDISEQKVPIPGLMITLVLNQEKSPDLLSHRSLEIFQLSSEFPMMIHGKNIPILDVPLFHLYPLDQFEYGGIGSSSVT
nr:hypothetical protein [Tanacetum cinerariifolium]